MATDANGNGQLYGARWQAVLLLVGSSAREGRRAHVTRHTSHVTRHTSHVTRHASHVVTHTPSVGSDRNNERCRAATTSLREPHSSSNCEKCVNNRLAHKRNFGAKTRACCCRCINPWILTACSWLTCNMKSHNAHGVTRDT